MKDNSHDGSKRDLVLLIGLLIVAAILRFIQLDSQLWLDEISAIENSLRRPLLAIATEWPGVASHVLFELSARISIAIFGETPFAVRLPAAIAGVIGVAGLAYLARISLSRRASFVAAGLFALSYHHIFYSQNARGYTTLIACFLIATILAVRILRSGSCSIGIGAAYAGALILSGYSHPFGLFVPAGHALAFSVLYFFRPAGIPAVPVKPLLGAGIIAGIVLITVYAPLLAGALTHARENIASPAEGPRLGIGLVIEVIEGLSAALGGPIGLLVAALIGLIGFLILVRRRAETLLLLILPIALQMAVFAAANVGIHPRYFAIALPAVILVGAEGLKHSVETLVKRFPFAATIRERTVVGCLALAVLASAQPLIRYYQYPKQDFLGAQTYIGSNARDDDLFFGIHSSGSVLGNFYDLPFRRIETLEELLEYESYGQRIWLVTTLERVISAAAPDLLEHIHNNYTQQIRFPGTVGDGTVIVYLLDGIADGD